jgi:hypothetical protein
MRDRGSLGYWSAAVLELGSQRMIQFVQAVQTALEQIAFFSPPRIELLERLKSLEQLFFRYGSTTLVFF